MSALSQNVPLPKNVNSTYKGLPAVVVLKIT